jgi:hypothetical protein
VCFPACVFSTLGPDAVGTTSTYSQIADWFGGVESAEGAVAKAARTQLRNSALLCFVGLVIGRQDSGTLST